MAAFTPSGSGGAVTTAQVVGAANPAVAHVSLTVAGTEYSYVLPTGTKQFQMRVSGDSGFTVSYVSAGLTYPVPRHCFYGETGLNLTAPTTIYVIADKPLQTLSILVWT